MTKNDWRLTTLYLHKQGWSGRRIARHLEMAKSTINDYLKRVNSLPEPLKEASYFEAEQRVEEEKGKRRNLLDTLAQEAQDMGLYDGVESTQEQSNMDKEFNLWIDGMKERFRESEKANTDTVGFFIGAGGIPHYVVDTRPKVSPFALDNLDQIYPENKPFTIPHFEYVDEKVTPEDIFGKKYKSILCIPDLHTPYHHPKAFEFLAYLKAKYNPDKVVCGGDEVDGHKLSYHEHDPDLLGARCEADKAKEALQELHKLFPEMDLLESNHGSLVYRKAKTAGIPRSMIKNYNEIWEVGEGWKWHFDLTLPLSNGEEVYFHHARSAAAMKTAQAFGMNVVEFHHHTKMSINYFTTPTTTRWAVQGGCLVDARSLAYHYGKDHLIMATLGAVVIVDGYPVLESLNKWLDEQKKR